MIDRHQISQVYHLDCLLLWIFYRFYIQDYPVSKNCKNFVIILFKGSEDKYELYFASLKILIISCLTSKLSFIEFGKNSGMMILVPLKR